MKKAAHRGPLRALFANWIAMGGSIAQFARDNPGASLRTLKRWSGEPDFQAEVRRESSRFIEDIRRRLTAGALKATDRLFKLVDNPNPTIQLGAAKAILDRLLDVNDAADHERRIADLEDIASREKTK